MVKPQGLLGTTFLLPLAEAFQHIGATLVTLNTQPVAQLAQKTVGAAGGNYELFLALMGQDLKRTPVDLAISFGGNQFLEETPSRTVRNFLSDLGVPQLVFLTRDAGQLMPFLHQEASRGLHWRGTCLVANSPDYLPVERAELRCFYLPPGTNPRVFHPLDESPGPGADAVFVGSFSIWRAVVLAHLVELLPLTVYGDWRFKLIGGLKACWREPVDYFTALNGVYASAACVLDLPLVPGEERVSARVLDTLAGGNAVVAPRCGLLDACLAAGTDYVGYAQVLADPNKLAPAFATLNQRLRENQVLPLSAIAREFALLADAARSQAQKIAAAVACLKEELPPGAVAQAGRECVMAQHLWEHRLPRLLDLALGEERVPQAV